MTNGWKAKIKADGSFFTRKPLHLLLVGFLGLLVYANTLQVPFQWDGEIFIAENPIVKDLDYFLSPSKARGMELYDALKSRYIGYLTFALNYALGGLEVRGFHLLNIFIHIANALLFYTLVVLTFRTPFLAGSVPAPRARSIALVSALIFVAHPVQIEAVTYIFQRLASLVSFFFLLSLVSYIRSRLSVQRTAIYTFYALSLLAAVLAMKTKENAFTLPLVLALYEFLFFGRPVKKRLARLAPLLLTALIIPLTLTGLDRPVGEIVGGIVPAKSEYLGLSRVEYLLTEFRVIITYIRLLFLPVHQNFDYDYPLFRSFAEPSVFLSFLFHLGLVGFAFLLLYRSRTKGREIRLIAFGILWFYITLAVESSIVPIPMVINEYRLYLPSAGAIMASITAAFLFMEKTRNAVLRKAVMIMLITVSMILGLAAWKRNAVWSTKVSLWEDTVAKSPLKARPHNNLGVAYALEGRTEDAIQEYRAAIRINPDDGEAHSNLGEAYLQLGATENAVQEFVTAVRTNPGNAIAQYNLGIAYNKLGRFDDAVKAYTTAIQLNPYYYRAHGNLGEVYFKLGDTENAIREFITAIRIEPGYIEGHYNLGKAYARQGRIEDAVNEYLAVIRLDGDYAKAHVNLGVSYFTLGKTERAIEEYLTALRINPGNAGVHYNLGIAYTRQGSVEDALNAYLSAVNLRPEFYEARYGLGLMHKMQGQYDEASREFQAVLQIKPDHWNARKQLQSIRNIGK